MITCHDRHHATVYDVQGRRRNATPVEFELVYVAQGQLWLAMPDVYRPSVLSTGNDSIPCSMLFDRVCCLQAKIACHARRRPTNYVVQGQRCRITTDFIRPRVFPNSDDGVPHKTSSDRVCCPREMWACHANVSRSCVLSKGDDNI
uniref:Uncharacterized protein n=1 Tax=Solanum lycopersicum TaxID=4081 RepID=A0A3Q7GPC6_SOLLC